MSVTVNKYLHFNIYFLKSCNEKPGRVWVWRFLGRTCRLSYTQKWNSFNNHLWAVFLWPPSTLCQCSGTWHIYNTNRAGASSVIPKGIWYIWNYSNTIPVIPLHSVVAEAVKDNVQSWVTFWFHCHGVAACPLLPMPSYLGVPTPTAVGTGFQETSWSLWDRTDISAVG